MLSDWAQAQGKIVIQREQHEHNVKKNDQKPQSGLSRTLPKIQGGVFCENRLVNS